MEGGLWTWDLGPQGVHAVAKVEPIQGVKLKPLLLSEVTAVSAAAVGGGLMTPEPKLKPVDEDLGSSSFFSCCPRLDTPN